MSADAAESPERRERGRGTAVSEDAVTFRIELVLACVAVSVRVWDRVHVNNPVFLRVLREEWR